MKKKPAKKTRELTNLVTPKKRRIVRVLEDNDQLALIQDMAETGAAISTINAKLGWPQNTLHTLLTKGRNEKKGPYKKFYRMFTKWAAEAKWAAESNMAKKTPEKFLDRSTTAKLIEDNQDTQLSNISNNETSALPPGVEAAKVLDALKILRKQGVSIDEAIDKNALDLLEGPTNEDK